MEDHIYDIFQFESPYPGETMAVYPLIVEQLKKIIAVWPDLNNIFHKPMSVPKEEYLRVMTHMWYKWYKNLPKDIQDLLIAPKDDTVAINPTNTREEVQQNLAYLMMIAVVTEMSSYLTKHQIHKHYRPEAYNRRIILIDQTDLVEMRNKILTNSQTIIKLQYYYESQIAMDNNYKYHEWNKNAYTAGELGKKYYDIIPSERTIIESEFFIAYPCGRKAKVFSETSHAWSR